MRVYMTFVVLNDTFNRGAWSEFRKTFFELGDQLQTETEMPESISIENPRVMKAAIEAAAAKMHELSIVGASSEEKAPKASPKKKTKTKPKARRRDKS